MSVPGFARREGQYGRTLKGPLGSEYCSIRGRAIHRNRLPQRGAVRGKAARATHAGDQGNVKELLHLAVESDPFDDVAVADVDDEQAAPRYRFSLGELLVQRQPLKPSVARQRQRDRGIVLDKCQAAQESWIEAYIVPRSTRRVEAAEPAGAGIQNPDAPPMDARRMRHGESFGDHATVTDVDDDTAVRAVLAPSIDDVRRRAGGDIANAALLHCEAVEM